MKRKITDTGKTKRLISPEEFAKALGAEPTPITLKKSSNLIDMAEAYVKNFLHSTEQQDGQSEKDLGSGQKEA